MPRALLLALGLLLTLPVGAAAVPQTTLNDVEDEVMCPICGTLLELSDAPQAQRQRAYIEGLIAAGRTKAQIKDALVTQYGQEVLAVPEDSGFELSAYLVPVIAFLIATAALAFGVLRWRRTTKQEERAPPPAAPRGEQAERLDADLSRYDL
ncbi:MAG TPA: cytochrome c-type biogenesis protein CcmH [Solirubrobacterales bacterium]|nr:cytochrome c-type biogenesis protein CcmH [Solirubrobacterales bacterium]